MGYTTRERIIHEHLGMHGGVTIEDPESGELYHPFDAGKHDAFTILGWAIGATSSAQQVQDGLAALYSLMSHDRSEARAILLRWAAHMRRTAMALEDLPQAAAPQAAEQAAAPPQRSKPAPALRMEEPMGKVLPFPSRKAAGGSGDGG